MIVKSLTVIFTVQLAYSGYIYWQEEVVAHLVTAIAHPMTFLPSGLVRQALEYDRFAGVMAANLYMAFHFLIYGFCVFFLMFLIFERSSRFVPHGKKLWEERRLFKGKEFKMISHVSSIMLKGTDTFFSYKDLSPKNTINIKRKPIDGVSEPKTKVEALTLAALERMNAYPDIPAALGGHHGSKNLLQHSINVLTEYSKLTGGHRLCEPIAVFHDIGKMITFKKKTTSTPLPQNHNSFQKFMIKNYPSNRMSMKWRQRKFKKSTVWEKETNNHEAAGMMILMQVPEFWELPETDRAIIKAVLKYKSGRLPLHLRDDKEIKSLITNLKVADGKALRNEVSESYKDAKKETENFEQVVDKMIFEAIRTSNINNHKRLHKSDGWMVEHMNEFIIQVSAIKNIMAESAGVELSRSLSLDVPYKKNVFSPFRQLCVDSLVRQGLLTGTVNGIDSNGGIFDALIGKQPFFEVLAINKEQFFNRLPEIPAWGDSQYVIKVKQNKSNWTELTGEDAEESAELDNIYGTLSNTIDGDTKMMDQNKEKIRNALAGNKK